MLTTIESLEIKGTEYAVELLPGKSVALHKGARTYVVTQGETRTTCDCPDFLHRHAHLEGTTCCKHIAAVVAAGLLGLAYPESDDEPTVEPQAPVAAEPAFTLAYEAPRKPAFDRLAALRSYLTRPWTPRDAKRLRDILDTYRWDLLCRENDDYADMDDALRAELKEWKRIAFAAPFPVAPKVVAVESKPAAESAPVTLNPEPVVDYYRSGQKIASIARMLGVSATTVRRRLEKAGVELPKRKAAKPAETFAAETVPTVAMQAPAPVAEAAAPVQAPESRPAVPVVPIFGTDAEYTLIIAIGSPCGPLDVLTVDCQPAGIVDDSTCDVYLAIDPIAPEPDPTPDPTPDGAGGRAGSIPGPEAHPPWLRLAPRETQASWFKTQASKGDRTMTLPRIHDNGTGSARLAERYESAYQAIELAMQAVKESAPNPRDWDDPLDFEDAGREHARRLRVLGEVMDEMERLAWHCREHTSTP